MTPPRSEVTEVQRIPLDEIRPSPLNVRQGVDVGSLTCSIGRAGQIEPLRLRPVEGGYEIRTGMRRFLALKEAGATHADAIVVEGTDEEVIIEQWDENEEREGYTDYERALKLRQMMDALGLTQAELAKRIGMGRSRIAQLLRILKLEEIVTPVTIQKMTEYQVRAILAAPEDVQASLVNYVELFLEEKGELLPASAIEDYARQLAHATEIGRNRRRFLYEIEEEAAGAVEELPGTAEEPASEAKAYIEEHDLSWVFDADANGAGFLTKITMLTDEELEFCLANEDRTLNLQRLNEEMNGRVPAQAPRPLLKEPPTTSAQVISFITERIGEPVEEIQAKLVEEHELNEEEAQAALQAYRETYPDIWSVCYPEEKAGETEEPEEPMTAEQYVADILHYNPEVNHAELVKATVEMFDDVSEAYVQGLIDRSRKRRDI
ncbi:ParB/RepB/Spo0J family partition protein, partial [Candidatus Bathyarchaeota archaeon]|nr:ParB/RepB/Spo0J family partition protein [Candidatus Bathyarchaeota archaeon]